MPPEHPLPKGAFNSLPLVTFAHFAMDGSNWTLRHCGELKRFDGRDRPSICIFMGDSMWIIHESRNPRGAKQPSSRRWIQLLECSFKILNTLLILKPLISEF